MYSIAHPYGNHILIHKQIHTVRQTDLTGIMEGIYIKVEDGDYVTDRLKFVRGSFLNTILDSESHWLKRPMIVNCLADGVDLFMN